MGTIVPLFALLFSTLIPFEVSSGPDVATGSLPGNGFGGAIAVAGASIFVGSAPAGWQTGSKPAGSIYQYERNEEGEWEEVARLSAADGTVGDHFGRALAATEGRLVVGAPGVGAAYVFEPDETGAWVEVAKLMPGSMDEGAEFGGAYARAAMRTGAIAVSDHQIVVASFHAGSSSGKAHVFRLDSGAWIEEVVLTSDLAGDGDGFGFSVAGEDGLVFVGAPAANSRAGAVHVFERMDDAGDWAESGQISDPDGEGGNGLGLAVEYVGGRLVVGSGGGGEVVVFAKSDGDWAVSERKTADARGYGMNVATNSGMLAVSARSAVVVHVGEDIFTIEAPDRRTTEGFALGLAVGPGFVVVGSPRADYEAGIASVFEPGQEGAMVRTAILASEVEYLDSITGTEEIECEDGIANAFECDGVDLVSFLSLGELAADRGVKMTDIWGWEDPETGKEWVLQARTEGVSFVDISDPANPVYVGQLFKTADSPGAAWRDVKVYRNHAYIVADGSEAHGVQIFDLTQLRDVDPADMPVTFEETAHYAGVHSTHNMVINEATGFAYAVGNRAGGEACGGQLHMIDIREPENPQFAGCFSVDGAGGTHDAQCVIYSGPDSDYSGHEVCFNSNGSTFIIADVTDKAQPVALANTSYPLQAYTHQGWLTEDQRYFYMNDELDEMNGLVDHTRTLIWDVQDLEDPQLVSEFLLDSGASDHNLYVRGNLMYQSNYQAGLRILDISDPVNPVEVGHFDTAPFAEDAAGFGGSWSNYPYFKSGVIAVSSRNEGLFLLRKQQRDL